jgi:hypothetical protein
MALIVVAPGFAEKGPHVGRSGNPGLPLDRTWKRS